MYAFSMFAFFRKKFGVVSREDLKQSETDWQEKTKTTFDFLEKTHEQTFVNFNDQIKALRENNEAVTKHLVDANEKRKNNQKKLDQLMTSLTSKVSTDFRELQEQFKGGEEAVKQGMDDLKLALELQKKEIESVFQNLQQTLTQTSKHMKEFADGENKKLLEIYESFSSNLDVQKKNIEEKITEFESQQKILESKAGELEHKVGLIDQKVENLSEQKRQDAELIQKIMIQREENKKKLQALQDELEDLNKELVEVLHGLGKKSIEHKSFDFNSSGKVYPSVQPKEFFSIASAKKYPPLFGGQNYHGQSLLTGSSTKASGITLLIENKK